MVVCAICAAEADPASPTCTDCGNFLGYPNVRRAEAPGEIQALDARLGAAIASADIRGCRTELEEFGRAVDASKAVIAMNLRTLHSLVCADNRMHANYHSQVGSGMRLAEDNKFDRNRIPIESKIHDLDVYKHISYAALSLNGVGVPWFGTHHITLADIMIERRASVLEENSFLFFEHHSKGALDPLPLGYRASWLRRGALAVAKLYLRIKPGTLPTQFPEILVDQSRQKSDSDFIEVHIYGNLPPRGFERVIGTKPTSIADEALWREATVALKKLGAVVEELA